MKFSSKLPNVGTTIFTVMSKMAAENGAVNLSQGFPDFPVAPEIVELVHQHMKQGHNQYAPMPGLPLLRQRKGKARHGPSPSAATDCGKEKTELRD